MAVEFFEGIWRIPEKITYNAYLVLEDDTRILLDGWKRSYSEAFLEAIKNIIDPRDLTHVIVHHMEPDHSGSLPRVLEANEFRAEVIAHPMTARMIKSFYGLEVKFRAVKDGEELRLGEAFKFIHVPWLHWPETIVTFLMDRGILFSGDAFGGYSIPESIFDDSDELISRYLPAVRKYVATIIGYYRSHIVRSIEKLAKLGISPRLIAPAHGLIWRNKPDLIIRYYEELAEGRAEDDKILIISGSMYGSTEKAANTAFEEARRLDLKPVLYSLNELEHASPPEIIGDAINSRAIVIASPTYEMGIYPPIEYIIRLISRKIPPKPVLIISSYGWAGVAARRISEILSDAGFKIIKIIDFQGSAGDAELEEIRRGVRALFEGR